ncbi:tail fiber assembly protein [Serratia marcescens]|uniref:tail fiber assembly protein n=1 Tax=Serratia marcescens TaxID=615 RepID=UPI0027906015|nr:tail fiber assembly protein [Serratia marcescens]MDP8716318.1 tail fiber assembly protein [Serratia marcescens]
MANFYSPSENIAYPDGLMASYKEAGTLPDDLIEITDNAFQEYFIELPPAGKYRTANNRGLPEWADIPSPTKESLVAMAESERQSRMSVATAIIDPLKDAVEMDMATDEEKSRYNAWRKYRVLLTRVDTSLAPDVSWPEPPKD